MSYMYKVVSDNHTHFSILNKEYIERDEYAEVEDIDTVLHSHLCKGKNTCFISHELFQSTLNKLLSVNITEYKVFVHLVSGN